MRVTGPLPQLGVTAAKPKRVGESGADFEVPEETSKSEAKSPAKTASVSSLGSLIAAQLHGIEKEEWEEHRRRRQNVRRGQDQLALLDDIKLEMLAGKLSPAQVLKLLASIEARERDSGDERLEAILDEIELRARVELAKLKRREVEQSA